MRYVDGFVLPVPKKNLKGRLLSVWLGWERDCGRKHGALDYKECIRRRPQDEVGNAVHANREVETRRRPWCSPISCSSRGLIVTASTQKVMEACDPRGGPKDMPFDIKRMVYGGFKVGVGG